MRRSGYSDESPDLADLVLVGLVAGMSLGTALAGLLLFAVSLVELAHVYRLTPVLEVVPR